jgi:hypothetical protein
MTNIKILKDRIIFDGHADTRQECETITLMCDNLAQSKNFKTVRYESGYAEFEKVGATNELKFVRISATVYMVWDSGVVSVTGPNGHEFTTSGSSYESDTLYDSSASDYNVTVSLKQGYIIDTVVGSSEEASSVTVSDVTDNSFVLDMNDAFAMGGSVTYTITTKQGTITPTKQTIDVSTLSGWESLASGNHAITVKTKASGYKDSAASNAVTVSKAGASYNVTVTGSNNNNSLKIYDGTSTSGTLLGEVSHQNSLTVTCTSGFLYIGFNGLLYQDDAVVTGGVSVSSTEGDFVLFKVTGDGTITVGFACLIEGTQITLADGSTKAIEDITYDDELLVWNFDKGSFDTAKPKWIKIAGTTPKYNLVKFSNGAEVGFVGAGGEKGYHRIFNKEAGMFTYTGNEKETPIGTTTFADDNSFPTVVSEEIIEKEVKFYNVITDKHFNIFANGILTSCRLSNMYRIENMKYVGERLITDEQVKSYFERIEQLRKHA